MYKAGDILGGCRLLQECGSGAFGSVFLAENETTHQRMALKLLLKTGRHYEREISALTAYQEKCRHANLMRIYHIGQNEDCLFYTMDAADPLNPAGDYVPDTLGNRLRQRKRLKPEEIRTMLHELLNGLELLHNAGLLHRDIKPDNVLWVDGHAVLGDIGLVTESEDASFAGTRGFISPAVWKGERGYETQDDLYALAMTLYCALTGNEPKGNLELPLSMTFSGCGDLIRAYNAVLDEDSQIRTVADFREALKKNRTGAKRSAALCVQTVTALLLLGVFAWALLRSIKILRNIPQGPVLLTPAAPPRKSGERKIAELAEKLKLEWRDHYRKRLANVRRSAEPVLNIRQGAGSRSSYLERLQQEADRAVRSLDTQNRIGEEEDRLARLETFAGILIRHFGDVADDDAPEIRALKRHDAVLEKKFLNFQWLRMVYCGILLDRSRGFPRRVGGKRKEFEQYINSLPAGERRLFIRRMVYEQLRADEFSGSNLLEKNISPAAAEHYLSTVGNFLDTL